MEEIQEANSAGQIDQLNELRSKMQPGERNFSLGEVWGVLENEMPGMGKEIPKEETYNQYGEMRGK